MEMDVEMDVEMDKWGGVVFFSPAWLAFENSRFVGPSSLKNPAKRYRHVHIS